MIRKAIPDDIPQIVQTYNDLLTYEEQNGSISIWKPDIYPTIQVPERKIPTRTMYVLENDGEICASIVLDQ